MKTKLLNLLWLALAPLALMGYGWYLGQLHQSGYDIAGILLFITGVAGFGCAMLLHWLTRKAAWHGRWYGNLLTGVAGTALLFVLVWVYAQLHG